LGPLPPSSSRTSDDNGDDDAVCDDDKNADDDGTVYSNDGGCGDNEHFDNCCYDSVVYCLYICGY